MVAVLWLLGFLSSMEKKIHPEKRNSSHSGKMQRHFLVSLLGKAEIVASSEGHSIPLLSTLERHIKQFI